MENDIDNNFSEVLDVAATAGHILLENGAEISRVEETMSRIATHFGVSSSNFFVLSNGIFTTGSNRRIEHKDNYANVEFIPIKAIQFDRVVAVGQLSYDISAGRCTLQQAKERLEEIRRMPAKPDWEQLLATAVGAGGFCAVFGGGWLDCAAAFAVGALLFLFIQFVSSKYLSKIVGGVCNAIVGTFLSVLFCRIGFGHSLSDIIIGAMMPLIPGVPFVNGVRDLANSDYIAGLTRLTDAVLGFFCIAIGVIVTFVTDGVLFGESIVLEGMSVSAQTAGLVWQALLSGVATMGFAALFGVPRSRYATCGFIGAFGWVLYLVLTRYAGAVSVFATVVSATVVCLLSRIAAVRHKTPSSVYLICGLFPLIPGAGIFWSMYYLVSEQFSLSFSSLGTALKVAVAIVMGIILGMELPQRLFAGRKVRRS